MGKTETNALILTEDMMTVTIDIDRPIEEINRATVQAAKLIAICVTAYPNSDKYQTAQAIKNTVNLWAGNFIDDDWRIVGLALAKHVSTSKWPPSIAEIREIMVEIQSPDLITPDEAWALVARNIDTKNGWENPERIFPAPIIRAVNAVGYNNLRDLRRTRHNWTGNKNAGLDRVAFEKAYAPEYEREKLLAQLPPHLRQALIQAQDALSGESRKLFNETDRYLAGKEHDQHELMRFIEHADRGQQYERQPYGGGVNE